MAKTSTDRLFPNEQQFIVWLAQMMEANDSFSEVAIEPIFSLSEASERQARADIKAIRRVGVRSEVLIIECKNIATLYGTQVTDAVRQLKHYGEISRNSRLVLAVAGNVSSGAEETIREANIELWDLDRIAHIFEKQLGINGKDFLQTRGLLRTRKIRPEELLIKELNECAPGRPQWSIYQRLVGRIIVHLFCPPLNEPLSENPDLSGVNRRDFVLANFAEKGFWAHLRNRYNAEYIVIDAKNSTRGVTKRDVLQMCNYLKPFGAGMFGIIVSRRGPDKGASVTVREQWAQNHKLVLILNDQHCEAMLRASAAGNAEVVIEKEIQDFRLLM